MATKKQTKNIITTTNKLQLKYEELERELDRASYELMEAENTQRDIEKKMEDLDALMFIEQMGDTSVSFDGDFVNFSGPVHKEWLYGLEEYIRCLREKLDETDLDL